MIKKIRSDAWSPSKEISEKIIRDYKNGRSAKKLGEEIGVADVTVTGFLKRSNISTRTLSEQKRSKYGLNENVFDEINEESAYWIGFILADGNLYKSPKHSWSLSIGLKTGDKDHLEKFKKFIGCTKDLYLNKKNKTYHISIYSDKICNRLMDFGITPRKSLIVKVPELLKNNRHFWRGMVDGDGWLSFNKGKYKTIGLCGTRDIIKDFIDFTKIERKIRTKKDFVNFAEVAYYSDNAKNVSISLYSDSKVYLDRKYIRYIEFQNKCNTKEMCIIS